MKRANVLKSALLALTFSAVVARPALAYFDPNVGGQLFQILAVAFGALTGLLLLLSAQIRMAFARLRRFLRDLLDRGGE